MHQGPGTGLPNLLASPLAPCHALTCSQSRVQNCHKRPPQPLLILMQREWAGQLLGQRPCSLHHCFWPFYHGCRAGARPVGLCCTGRQRPRFAVPFPLLLRLSLLQLLGLRRGVILGCGTSSRSFCSCPAALAVIVSRHRRLELHSLLQQAMQSHRSEGNVCTGIASRVQAGLGTGREPACLAAGC